jgi:hypothetical protein
MIRTAPPPPRRARRLAQQQSDFTAEGSPPPGRVALEIPATPDTARPGNAEAAARKTSRRAR